MKNFIVQTFLPALAAVMIGLDGQSNSAERPFSTSKKKHRVAANGATRLDAKEVSEPTNPKERNKT